MNQSWLSDLDFSLAGRKLAAASGIGELMEDLGQAVMLEPDMRMLGGGNPAPIPQVQALLRERMRQMLEKGEPFDRIIGSYEPPQGNPRFRCAVAELLRRNFGWEVGPQNIAITPGAQSAFFFLFNLLAGTGAKGQRKKILLPVAPEYIGYADQGLEPYLFVACRPAMEWVDGPERRRFKYRIDFDAVANALRHESIGALAVSRPTNPSGNVLSDVEVCRLADLAAAHGIPLILDSAYGAPFPGILFVPARPFWQPHVILTLSLSKLGLPGTRTGIVVAPEPIAKAIGSMTAIVGLANTSVGQELVLPWVEDGTILEMGPKILRPFYEQKSRQAAQWTAEFFSSANVDWALHASEGAFFHWLWLRDLRITTRELYTRLKARQVLTVPGEYFFFGLDQDWPHRHECLRLNFSQSAETVRVALEIIAQEAAQLRR